MNARASSLLLSTGSRAFAYVALLLPLRASFRAAQRSVGALLLSLSAGMQGMQLGRITNFPSVAYLSK